VKNFIPIGLIFFVNGDETVEKGEGDWSCVPFCCAGEEILSEGKFSCLIQPSDVPSER
jgi:hypothetical protein